VAKSPGPSLVMLNSKPLISIRRCFSTNSNAPLLASKYLYTAKRHITGNAMLILILRPLFLTLICGKTALPHVLRDVKICVERLLIFRNVAVVPLLGPVFPIPALFTKTSTLPSFW